MPKRRSVANESDAPVSFVVAIDGPAAAGKGTIARAVAQEFGFAHLDTGLLYRAVGKRAINMGRGVIDEGVAELCARELQEQDVVDDGLRTVLVSRAASRVAALPGVRSALLDFQRKFAKREDGAVLDGRDIGTVICPEADVKLYVTATDETRAQRRFDEVSARGEETTLIQITMDLQARDTRDAGREDAPMRRSEDAHLLDTSEMTIEQAVAAAVEIVRARRA